MIRNGILCYGSHEYASPLIERRWIHIGEWKVLAFPVKHTNTDETECPNLAFIIRRNGELILYMTDWMYCGYRLTQFGINHFLIAVNYSQIPDGENRNHVLRGHASLDTVRDFLLTNLSLDTKSIIACHLSEVNADEDIIKTELEKIAPSGVLVEIAEKGKVINLE